MTAVKFSPDGSKLISGRHPRAFLNVTPHKLSFFLLLFFLAFCCCCYHQPAGQDGLLQVFQVDIDPPQTLARSLEAGEDFRYLRAAQQLSTIMSVKISIFFFLSFRQVSRLGRSIGPAGHGPWRPSPLRLGGIQNNAALPSEPPGSFKPARCRPFVDDGRAGDSRRGLSRLLLEVSKMICKSGKTIQPSLRSCFFFVVSEIKRIPRAS